MRLFTCVSAIAVLLAAGQLHGQTVHLAPLPEVTFPKEAVLLSFSRATDSSILSRNGVKVRIAGGRIYLLHPEVPAEIIELGDRTIAELITQLRAKYEGIQITSDYPELSTRYLRTGTIESKDDVFLIGGRQSAPTVRGLLGLGFALNEIQRDATSSRLLHNGGFHLDLVGTKQFENLALRTRIGFRSGEAISVTQERSDSVDGGEDPSEPASVTSFVETAERITIGAHLDYVFGGWEELRGAFGVEVAGSWNALPAFVFPAIRVDSLRVPINEVFDSAQIAPVRERLDRVVPLGSVLAGPRIIVGPREEQLFYAQLDAGFIHDPVRIFGVRYRVDRDAAGQIVRRIPDQPFARVGLSVEPVWRVGVGSRLAGVVDLRVDATGQIWRRNNEIKPLLRILIGSNLELGR